MPLGGRAGDSGRGKRALAKQDYATAQKEFENAAKRGNAEGMYLLGTMYSEGQGVAQDEKRGFELIQKAATADYTPAQSMLARLYAGGRGVTRDNDKSIQWARRAADKGDALSQYIMGLRSAEGWGVPKDPQEALPWFGAWPSRVSRRRSSPSVCWQVSARRRAAEAAGIAAEPHRRRQVAGAGGAAEVSRTQGHAGNAPVGTARQDEPGRNPRGHGTGAQVAAGEAQTKIQIARKPRSSRHEHQLVIRRMAEQHGMIEPLRAPPQVRSVDGKRIVSYGTSSYGYDIRCSDDFKIFTNINSTIVDPKNFDEKSFVDFKGDVCIIPPNSFALARTVEYFRIPRSVLTVCLGKSNSMRAAASLSTSRPFEP